MALVYTGYWTGDAANSEKVVANPDVRLQDSQ